MDFKIVKKIDFKFEDSSKKQISGTVYTVARKGRIYNVSTLNFEAKELVAKGDVLSTPDAIVVVKDNYMDDLGLPKIGLKLMPKNDLEFE